VPMRAVRRRPESGCQSNQEVTHAQGVCSLRPATTPSREDLLTGVRLLAPFRAVTRMCLEVRWYQTGALARSPVEAAC
jgi:hypothetical protein